jgi:hypothetical protein
MVLVMEKTWTPRNQGNLGELSAILWLGRIADVFVHVDDGRRWYIPACALGGHSHVSSVGRKYAEFEIEAGPPLRPAPRLLLSLLGH